MKDKTTILVVVACMIALVGWQLLITKLYPPIPKKPKPISSSTDTNAAPSAVAATATNAPPTTGLTTNEGEAQRPRAPEQVVTLRNSFVRVEFTSWGGGIRSVELLKHKANGESSSNVVLNGDAFVPSLALEGVAGIGPEASYELNELDPSNIVMRAHARSGIEVTKRVSLGEHYLLKGNLQIQWRGVAPTNSLAVEIGTATLTHAKELPTFLAVAWMEGGKFQYRDLTRVAKNEAKGLTQEPISSPWAAVKNQFFTMILTLPTNAAAIKYERVELPRPTDWKAKEPPRGLRAAAELAPTTTTTNAVTTYDFSYYAGPKEYNRLVALGKGQEEVMQFGFWGVISVVLLQSMNAIHNVIPNYGVAIIIITFAIKLLFWPIQAKSIKSMKQMQKFQPLMNKLKDKYKDDPQRMNAEMMKLYKEHKINPMSGCLPMVVQIPVFFALFTMLRSSIELRGASFLWIKDLSQPDTIFTIAGLPLNPLPLIMVGAMIWQQKITPTTGDQQQAKMMMFMPVMMLLFFYNASSGLALYWTVQQFLSIGQQWWSLRQHDASPGMSRLEKQDEVR